MLQRGCPWQPASPRQPLISPVRLAYRLTSWATSCHRQAADGAAVPLLNTNRGGLLCAQASAPSDQCSAVVAGVFRHELLHLHGQGHCRLQFGWLCSTVDVRRCAAERSAGLLAQVKAPTVSIRRSAGCRRGRPSPTLARAGTACRHAVHDVVPQLGCWRSVLPPRLAW